MGTLKNDYSLSISVNVDTSKAQKDLDRFKKANSEGKNPLILQPDINTAKVAEKLEKLGNLQGFQKINTKVSKIFQINDKPFIKATETFKNALGDIQERVVLFKQTSTGNFQEVQRQTIQLANGVKNVTESFSTSERTVGKYEATVKTLTKTITDTAGNTQQVITKTTEWVGSGNKLNTVIETLDANGNKLSATIHKIGENTQKSEAELKALAEGEQLVNRTIEKSNVVIARNGQEFKALVTSTTEVKANGDKLKTTITEYTDALGRAVTETRKFDSTNKQVGQTLTTIDGTAKKASTGVMGLASSFVSCVGKIAKFYTATMPIMAVMTAITQAKEAVFDFDFALTEFNKVTELSSDEIDGYTKKLGELGAEVGRTRTEMVEASTEFRRGGFSSEESAQLAKTATMFQNVSDAEISASDSASFLISQMKAFNIEASESEHIIDGVNEVAANFAVSTDDLVTALKKAGSALGTVGNDYNQTIALVTSAEEILQGQSSKVGLGLRTIAINLAKVASTAKGTEATINGVTFAVKDQNGQMLNTYEILKNLKPEWDKLTKAGDEQTKTLLGQTIAGKNRFDVFVSAMNNFSQAEESYETALESSGSAQRQNAVYMESLKAKIAELKAQFEELVLGNGGLHDLITAVLNAGINILKFANSDMGQFIIKATALVVAINLGVKAFTTLNTAIKGLNLVSFIGQLVGLTTAQASATATTIAEAIATEGLAGAFGALTVAMMTNPIGLIAVALAGLIGALITATNQTEDFNQELDAIHEHTSEAVESVKKAEDEVKNLKKELQDLEDKKVTLTDEEDLEKLSAEEQILKNELAIQEEQLRIEKEKASLKAQESLQTKVKIEGYMVKDEDGGDWYEEFEGTRAEAVQKYIEILKEEEAERRTLKAEMAEMAKNGEIESEAYQEKADRVKELNSLMNEQKNTANKMAGDILEEADALDRSADADGKYNEANRELYRTNMDAINSWAEYTEEANNATDATNEVTESTEDYGEGAEDTESDLEKLAKSLRMSTKELIDNADAAGMTVENYAEIRSALNSVVNEMKNLQSSYGSLNSIIEDYNDNGEISFENLESLLSLNPEYISMLTMENGKLQLNKDAINAKAEALKLEAIEQASETAVAQLNTLASQANAEASQSNASTKIASIADWEAYKGKIQETTQALAENTAEEALNQAVKDAGDSAIKAGADFNKVNDIMDNYKNTVKLVNSAQLSATTATKKSSGATGSHTKATNDNTKALEKNVKALEKQKKALEKKKKDYDDVIGYIKDKVNGLIETLEEESEREQGILQKEIDRLEKEKDYKDSIYENEIKNIEKQEKAWDKYYKKEKNRLKESKDYWENYYEEIIKITRESTGDVMEGLEGLEEYYKNQKQILDDLKDAYSEEKKTKLALLEKENDELKDQIELEKLLQNLEQAKTKRKRVYKEGQGFVYEQDVEAVSKAQQELQKYNREKAFENQKKSIEDYYDSLSNNTQKSLDDLTKWYNETKNIIEKEKTTRINAIEKELDALEKQNNTKTEAWDEEKDRLKEEQDSYDKWMESKISGLEFEQNHIKQIYDERIKYYENWLKQFEEKVTAYDTKKIAEKAYELTGVNFEQDGWTKRLDNLNKFIEEYTKKRKDLDEITKKYDKAKAKYDDAKSADSGSGGGGGSYGGSGGGDGSKNKKKTTTDDLKNKNPKKTSNSKKYTVFQILGTYDTQTKANKKKEELNKSGKWTSKNGITKTNDGKKYWVYQKVSTSEVEEATAKNQVSSYTSSNPKNKYSYKLTSKLATGTYGVKDDMIAIVGDNPNYQELAVGSRINNGTSMMLKSGTGIVPNNLTSTLVSMAKSYRDGTMKLQSNDVDKSTNISISNISLPQVHNGKEFVDYLQNFSLDMTQVAYSK